MQATAEDKFVGKLTELLDSWQFKEEICEQISTVVEGISDFYGQRCARMNLDPDRALFLGWLLPPNISGLIKQSNEVRSMISLFGPG